MKRWAQRKSDGLFPTFLWPQLRKCQIRRRGPEHAALVEALQLPEENTEVLISFGEQSVLVDILIGKLIVEVDGATHAQKTGRSADRARDEKLKALGYSVLRVWNWEIEEDLPTVLQKIRSFTTSK